MSKLVLFFCLATLVFGENDKEKPDKRFFGGIFGGGDVVNPVNPGIGQPGFGGGLGGGLGGGFGGGLGGGLGGGFGSNQCRYWCRTPEGQAYCCENSNQLPSLVGVKPGICPPVRPVCPPVRSFSPPQTCSNDGSCPGVDKCCFDRCLGEHVCKLIYNAFG